MRRVVLFGLDGAGFNLILPWVQEGRLPAFARLLREGSRGVLKSTHLPITVPAWAAMLTGKNPGRLGYCDFSERKNGSYHFGAVDVRWNEIDPIWKTASGQGKSVCVFNVPTTPLPNYPLNGTFIAGPGPLELGLGSRWAVPERVNHQLEAVGYRNAMSFPGGLSVPEILAHLQQQAELQCQLATRFLSQEPWDLFIFCLFATDPAEHLCLGENGDMPALLSIYQVADRWLASPLEHLPDGCDLVVVSDHGQAAMRLTVDLNFWLKDQGLLVSKPGRRRWLSRSGIHRLISQLRLFALYKRLTAHKLIGRVDTALKKRIPWQSNFLEEIDWSRTQAYCLCNGGFFLNCRGREPQGIVGEGGYELLREKIMAGLQTLTDPETGEVTVKQCWRREEVYNGGFLDKMPDIVVGWQEGYGNLVSEGVVFRGVFGRSANAFRGGVHTRDGIFMAWGPDIVPGKDLGRASLLSVAPTVLHLLGLPVPADMDGPTLREILQPGSFFRVRNGTAAESRSGAPGDRYSPQEERLVIERLRKLGYLE